MSSVDLDLVVKVPMTSPSLAGASKVKATRSFKFSSSTYLDIQALIGPSYVLTFECVYNTCLFHNSLISSFSSASSSSPFAQRCFLLPPSSFTCLVYKSDHLLSSLLNMSAHPVGALLRTCQSTQLSGHCTLHLLCFSRDDATSSPPTPFCGSNHRALMARRNSSLSRPHPIMRWSKSTRESRHDPRPQRPLYVE